MESRRSQPTYPQYTGRSLIRPEQQTTEPIGPGSLVWLPDLTSFHSSLAGVETFAFCT
jgi:hypothetical protein